MRAVGTDFFDETEENPVENMVRIWYNKRIAGIERPVRAAGRGDRR